MTEGTSTEQVPFVATDPDWDELGIDPNESNGVDSGEYTPSSQFPPPPPIGNVSFRGVSESFKWGRSNSGLYLFGKVEIVGGQFDGRKVDTFVSTRVTSFRPNGTDMDDFLRGVGLVPNDGHRFTNAEIANGVKNTWTQVRKGYLNWEGYCKECGKTVAKGKKGSSKEYNGFKQVGFERNGQLVPIVQCPICGKPVSAQGKITKFYAA